MLLVIRCLQDCLPRPQYMTFDPESENIHVHIPEFYVDDQSFYILYPLNYSGEQAWSVICICNTCCYFPYHDYVKYDIRISLHDFCDS